MLPLERRQLEFSGGFVGPPTPRDQVGAGCPDMENLVLTPGGGALRPMPGYQRTYPHDLKQPGAFYRDDSTGESAFFTADPGDGYTVLASMLRIVTFPAQALLTSGGRGIGVVDEVTERAVGLCFHPGGVPLDPAGTPADRLPVAQGRLNRQTAHDYPWMKHYRGKTYVGTAVDDVWVWDGSQFGRADVRGPVYAPLVSVPHAEDVLLPGDGYVATGQMRIKYVGSGSEPSVSFSATEGLMRFYSDYTVPILDEGVGVVGVIDLDDIAGGGEDTYGDLVGKINTATDWRAFLVDAEAGDVVEAAGTDMASFLLDSERGLSVRDQWGAELIAQTQTPSSVVAMTISYTGPGSDPTIGWDNAGRTLKFYSDFAGGPTLDASVGVAGVMDLGSADYDTYGEIVSSLAGSDWHGRLVDAGAGEDPLDGSSDCGQIDPDTNAGRSVVLHSEGALLLWLSSVPVAVLETDDGWWTGGAPFSVTFRDLSSGLVTTRTWDFGDGERSMDSAPGTDMPHTYTYPGRYTVRLSVGGVDGHSSDERVLVVTASNVDLASILSGEWVIDARRAHYARVSGNVFSFAGEKATRAGTFASVRLSTPVTLGRWLDRWESGVSMFWDPNRLPVAYTYQHTIAAVALYLIDDSDPDNALTLQLRRWDYHGTAVVEMRNGPLSLSSLFTVNRAVLVFDGSHDGLLSLTLSNLTIYKAAGLT